MTSHLNSAQLRPLGLERALPAGDFDPANNDLSRYDRDTFWLDAFYDGRCVVLICPKLHGLGMLLTDASYFLDGQQVYPKPLRSYRRYDCIILPCKLRPTSVRVSYQGHECTAQIADAPQDRSLFAGKNTLVTLSKNDPLSVITDWAHYHKVAHNAQAVLFFDNGSDRHSIAEIEAAMSEVGLDTKVIGVPQPYGVKLNRRGGGRYMDSEMLQATLLNIARLRFLPRARAVLQCDVDELVWCNHGSIFDKAARSVTGFVQLGARWRYAAPELAGDRLQDHIYTREGGILCRGKYCLRPGRWGALGSWGVHTLETLPRRSDKHHTRAGIWHCAGISSSAWVGDRNARDDDMTLDEKAAYDLGRVFKDRD